MNAGRLVGVLAGLPRTVAGSTINRFCGSSMQAVHTAAGSIAMGAGEAYVCAGVESMSRVPMGGFNPMPHPGLAERYPQIYISMGETAENVAERYRVSREDQDAFALESHRRAIAAAEAGRFDDEIVTVDVPQPKGDPVTIHADEGPRADTSLERLAALKPIFRQGGTVTAGNASQINDGAACVVVTSEERARELGREPLARIVASASAGVDPAVMGIGPVPSTRKALERAGLEPKDIDLVELNEAFASQVLASMRELGFDHDRLNVNGGAIALGHPLGCSGARLIGTLAHELRRRGGRYGVATMCIGVGQGLAAVIENPAA